MESSPTNTTWPGKISWTSVRCRPIIVEGGPGSPPPPLWAGMCFTPPQRTIQYQQYPIHRLMENATWNHRWYMRSVHFDRSLRDSTTHDDIFYLILDLVSFTYFEHRVGLSLVKIALKTRPGRETRHLYRQYYEVENAFHIMHPLNGAKTKRFGSWGSERNYVQFSRDTRRFCKYVNRKVYLRLRRVVCVVLHFVNISVDDVYVYVA